MESRLRVRHRAAAAARRRVSLGGAQSLSLVRQARRVHNSHSGPAIALPGRLILSVAFLQSIAHAARLPLANANTHDDARGAGAVRRGRFGADPGRDDAPMARWRVGDDAGTGGYRR